jgi:hypothetical protein
MAKTFISIAIGTPADADFIGQVIDLDTLPISYITSSIGSQWFYSGSNGLNANIVIQVSNDGINFNTGIRQSLGVGSSFVLLDLKLRYVRVAFEKGSNATGTINAISYIK